MTFKKCTLTNEEYNLKFQEKIKSYTIVDERRKLWKHI